MPAITDTRAPTDPETGTKTLDTGWQHGTGEPN